MYDVFPKGTFPSKENEILVLQEEQYIFISGARAKAKKKSGLIKNKGPMWFQGF